LFLGARDEQRSCGGTFSVQALAALDGQPVQRGVHSVQPAGGPAAASGPRDTQRTLKTKAKNYSADRQCLASPSGMSEAKGTHEAEHVRNPKT
jgi:hypothetical protein